MVMNLLTDKEIKKIKPTAKAQWVSDGGGLYIYVPSKSDVRGSVRYRWKYRYVDKETGKQVWYKGEIGFYPGTSLAEARKKRDELRSQVNPNKILEESERQNIRATIKTFGAVVELWYEEWKNTVVESTSDKEYQRIAAHIRTHENYNKLICDVTTEDIAKHLHALPTPTAHKIKSIYNKVFRYAEAMGYAKNSGGHPIPNPTPKETLIIHKKYKEKKYPGITDIEKLSELIRSINGYEYKLVRCALYFLMHCAVRGNDMRNLTWENIDWENKVITVTKTKNGRPLLIPMSTQVETMLIELKASRNDGFVVTEYVFHKEGDFKRPISNCTTNSALRRLGYDTKTEHTSHGFRTTFSSLCHEMWDKDSPYNYNIIEMQLDHTVGTGVSKIYNESTQIEARRKLMQNWSDFLDEIGYSKKAAA